MDCKNKSNDPWNLFNTKDINFDSNSQNNFDLFSQGINIGFKN
jgi:hypothetical protein